MGSGGFRSSSSPEETRLVLLFLLLSRETLVEAQSRVVGSPRPIVASPGDDVILPCYAEPPVDMVGFTVEWSRLDLHPDWVDYVHLYRDHEEVLNVKLRSYTGRTELFTDGLRDGNASLKILNVTLEDEGTYRCYIPKFRSRVRSSVLQLLVEPRSLQTETPLQLSSLQPPGGRGGTDVTGALPRSRVIPAGLFIFLLMVVGVGVTGSLTQKSQKEKFTQAGCLAQGPDGC